MSADRVRRVASLVKQNVASILLERSSDPLMQWITITDCMMTRDLKRADLYFSTIQPNLSRQEGQALLERKKGAIKRALGKRIVLKFMPELNFIWDKTVLIDEKLKEIKGERPQDT